MPASKKPAAKNAATRKPASKVFSADEKAAMKELVRERKANLNRAEAEAECLAKIAEMAPSDRRIAERIHALVGEHAPVLAAKTWYGMPAYAKDGGIVCFFQAAGKFKARYATLGFTDKANIDDGEMFPTYYALKSLAGADEAKVVALLRKAVS